MSATGLEVFDKTIQTTNIWLDEIMRETGLERRAAWNALGAVLHALRDQMPVDHSAHMAAQLPILVRGQFYGEWRPADVPDRIRSQDAFLDRVSAGLEPGPTIDPAEATTAVMGVLARHLAPGETAKVKDLLPKDIRVLWPEAA